MEHWAKKMGLTRMGMLIASKPHCHPRLPQPILKILSIYSKNFSRKQLSSNMLFILLHTPKFQRFR